MRSLKDFLHWYNNKKNCADFSGIAEKHWPLPGQKISICYSLVLLYQTWPTLVYTSTDAKLYQFTEGEKKFLENI